MVKNYDDNLSQLVTGRQTVRRTDRIGISISHFSSRMLTRDKNQIILSYSDTLTDARMLRLESWNDPHGLVSHAPIRSFHINFLFCIPNKKIKINKPKNGHIYYNRNTGIQVK